MKFSTLIGFTLASAIVLPAFADGTNTPVIDKREANQQQRIEQGEKSGALTNKEANHLEKREGKLSADEAAAKADGKLTGKERAELKREANQNSRAIEKEKHNKARVKKEKKAAE